MTSVKGIHGQCELSRDFSARIHKPFNIQRSIEHEEGYVIDAITAPRDEPTNSQLVGSTHLNTWSRPDEANLLLLGSSEFFDVLIFRRFTEGIHIVITLGCSFGSH